MFYDIVVPILNLVTIGFLSWCAFCEKERGDEYRQKYLDAMNKLMDLEIVTSEHELDTTEVTFTVSDEVKSDPEFMQTVDGLMDAVGAKLDQRTRVANRTLEALRRMAGKIESGEPIAAKRVTVEITPDGPLTTVDDVIL